MAGTLDGDNSTSRGAGLDVFFQQDNTPSVRPPMGVQASKVGLDTFFKQPTSQQPANRAIDASRVDAIAKTEGLTPTQRAVMGALLGQESGNGTNQATSIDGARGAGQIMPDTFRRYAKPGEVIDNQDHNLAVMARIVRDVGKKAGDDPARIAVGYFSGDGNINYQGGTPWKNDAKDGNGKAVSGYVRDVMGRLGGAPIATETKVASAPQQDPLQSAPKWPNIVAKPEFQAMSSEERVAARDAYFKAFIAPHIQPSQSAQYRTWFDAEADKAEQGVPPPPTTWQKVKDGAASVINSFDKFINPADEFADVRGRVPSGDPYVGDAYDASKVGFVAAQKNRRQLDALLQKAEELKNKSEMVPLPEPITRNDVANKAKAFGEGFGKGVENWRDGAQALGYGAGELFSGLGQTAGLLLTAPAVVHDKVMGYDKASSVAFDIAVKPFDDALEYYKRGGDALPQTSGVKVSRAVGHLLAALPAIIATGGGANPQTAYMVDIAKYAFSQGMTREAVMTLVNGARITLGDAMVTMSPAAIPGASEHYQRLIEVGVDGETAAKAAFANYATTTALGAIPLWKAGGVGTRVATGAVGGAAIAAGATSLQNSVLHEYPDQQQDPLDKDNLIVGGVTGGLLAGAMGHDRQNVTVTRTGQKVLEPKKEPEFNGTTIDGETGRPVGDVDPNMPLLGGRREPTMEDAPPSSAGAPVGSKNSEKAPQPTASATPVAKDVATVSDAEVLQYARTRFRQLRALRDGNGEEIVGENGRTDAGTGTGRELSEAEAQELSVLEQLRGNASELAKFYGFHEPASDAAPLDASAVPAAPAPVAPQEDPIAQRDLAISDYRAAAEMGDEAAAMDAEGKLAAARSAIQQQQAELAKSVLDQVNRANENLVAAQPTETPKPPEVSEPSKVPANIEAKTSAELAVEPTPDQQALIARAVKGGAVKPGSLRAELFRSGIIDAHKGLAPTRTDKSYVDGHSWALDVLGKTPKDSAPTKVLPPSKAQLPAQELAGEKTAIDVQAHTAATSPHNDLPEPTQAQKAAGNYKKGHISLHGLEISIENPVGSTRSGVARDGKRWESTMQYHYGYIKGTRGMDKDHIDVFIGPNPESQKVFVVDQIDPATKKPDEHKIMLGFDSKTHARDGYLVNYEAGWQGGKKVTETTMQGLKDWLATGDTSKPFALPKTEKQASALNALTVKEMSDVQLMQAREFYGPDHKRFPKIEKEIALRAEDAANRGAAPYAQQTVQSVVRTAKSEQSRPIVEQEPIISFATEKGSIYNIGENGTTARIKAKRPEHGDDFGVKEASEKTYYADADAMAALNPTGIDGNTKWRIVDHGDNTLSLATSRDSGRWGIAPSSKSIRVTNVPQLGFHPIELWGKGELNGFASYSGIHPGSAIASVVRAPTKSANEAANRGAKPFELRAPDDNQRAASKSKQLTEIAERLGIVVDKKSNIYSADGGIVQIPAEDKQVAGAISVDHVFAHELGHAIMQKRNVNFHGFPKKEMLKQIANYDELISASIQFRPEVHAARDDAIRRHATKPNEVLADAIGSVLLGNNSLSLLRPMMHALGWTERDLGLQNFASAERDQEKPIEITTKHEPTTSNHSESNSSNAAVGDPVGIKALQNERGREKRSNEHAGKIAERAGDSGASDRIVSGASAPVRGEQGDQPIHREHGEFEPTELLAGIGDGRGGRDAGGEGISANSGSATATDVATAQSGVVANAAKLKLQREAEPIKVAFADKGNIAKTLPYLNGSQHEDVHTAEVRFSKPDGYGMLFTNGTGTGKTFLGLGQIKRFVKAGKGAVLIVVPNEAVAKGWIDSGKSLLLDIHQLANIDDSGKGVSITTYANFSNNKTIADREYDLVIADEAHELMRSQDASLTASLNTLRAITLHPSGVAQRGKLLHRNLHAQIAELTEKADALAANDKRTEKQGLALKKLQDDIAQLAEQLAKASNDVRNDVAARQGAARPRALFLSATPFAYEVNIQWAEGYLFNYPPKIESGAYNTPSPYAQFMIENFGYRMRYGKLTQPDAKVDSGIMQRQFNTRLRKEGVLSARLLDVDADYDRKFVLVKEGIGSRIDEGLQWLREADDGKFMPLYEIANKRFDYLTRARLLEAIKAADAIEYIKQHHALGRKVIVFHDYNDGGGFSPFQFDLAQDQEITQVRYKGGERIETKVNLRELLQDFRKKRPDLIAIDTGALASPITALRNAFPSAGVYNGMTAFKKTRMRDLASFNDDNKPAANLLIVQSAANSGWSGHDTTGKHQRVLINLGLPTAPTKAIQQEGRIYRVGQASNALFRYMNTGTNWERAAFASTIARRASTAENMAMGEQARGLLQVFVDAFESSDAYAPGKHEGVGGKQQDRAAVNALNDFDRAKAFYFGQQKKTSRNKSAEGKDYYATPEPVGAKKVEWLDAKDGGDYLEPSAGHGAIARWLPENTNRTVIEPSSALASRLALVTDAKLINAQFEEHHLTNKYDGIVMNPPFGVGGKLAIEHLEKAAGHLRDGGRIVATLPRGGMADKRLAEFLYGETDVPAKPLTRMHGGIYAGDKVTLKSGVTGTAVAIEHNLIRLKLANDTSLRQLIDVKSVEPLGVRTVKARKSADLHLVADIKMPPATFERAGTNVATHIIVLERQSDATLGERIQTRQIDLSDASDINELFERIEHIELPRRQSEGATYNDLPDLARSDSLQTDEPMRVATLAKLKALQLKLDANKLTEKEFQLAVSNLILSLQKRNETKKINSLVDVERGEPWLRERLLRAKRQGDVMAEAVDFALWALDKNPAIATDLGISVRSGDGGAAGNYHTARRVITLFKGSRSPGTAVHEILHHTEKMLPPDVQRGIVREWQRAWANALSGSEGKVRAALQDILLAANGDREAEKRVAAAFREGTLQYDPHYALVNPSEFWAVKSTAILAGRYAVRGTWVGQAKQWMGEFVQKARGWAKLPSNAPVLAGLKAVMKGDGAPLSSSMIAELRQDAGAGGYSLSDIPNRRQNVERAQAELIKEFGKPQFKSVDWWDKTIGTQFHKAQKHPYFKRVFDLALKRENVVSLTANRAGELAPAWIPRTDDFSGALKTIIRGKNTSPQMAKASDAIISGTLQGASVLDGKVWTDEQLRSDFALDDIGIALYKQARAAIDASLDDVAAAEGFALTQMMLPRGVREQVIDDPANAYKLLVGAVDKQIQLDEMRQRGLLRAGAAQSKIDDVAEAIRAGNELRTKLDDIFGHLALLKEAGYAPLMRFGKFFVSVEEIDPLTGKLVLSVDGGAVSLFFGRYETTGEAERDFHRLKEQFRHRDDLAIKTGPVNEDKHKMFNGTSPETIALFGSVIGAAEATRKFYEQAVSDRSALKRIFTRKNIAGFSQDLPRMLANFITSNGRLAAQRYYTMDLNNAIRYIPREKGDVQSEAQKLKEFIDNPDDKGAMASSAAFAWFLGGNIASAAINATQPLMVSFPYLAQRGAAKAADAMMKAMPYAFGKRQITEQQLRTDLKRAAQEGKVDAQEIFHMYSVGIQGMPAALANQLGSLPIVGGKVKESAEDVRARLSALSVLWGMPFAMVEGFNRRLTFIAAWTMANEKGFAFPAGIATPYEFAVRAVDETQGIYNKVNRPNWARNGVGRTLMVFQQFKIFNMENLKRWFTKNGPAGRKSGLIFLALLVAAAGLTGLPFAEDIGDMIDTIGQWLGYNTNSKRSQREWAYSLLGKEFGDVALYGLSTQTPSDTGSRMGLGNFFPGTAIGKPSTNGQKEKALLEIGGAVVGGLGQQVTDAYEAASVGDVRKAATAMAPTAIRNFGAGLDMLTTGKAKDYKGRTKADVSKVEAIGKMAGFNPTVVSNTTRASMPIQQDLALQRIVEAKIVDLWASGAARNDKEMMDRAYDQLTDWNKKNPDTPIVVNAQQIKAKAREMLTPANGRLMKAAPREMRGRVAAGLDAVGQD